MHVQNYENEGFSVTIKALRNDETHESKIEMTITSDDSDIELTVDFDIDRAVEVANHLFSAVASLHTFDDYMPATRLHPRQERLLLDANQPALLDE